MNPLDPKAPMDIAKRFRVEKQYSSKVPTLHFWQGQFYFWVGCHYEIKTTEWVRKEIYVFLEGKVDTQGKPIRPTKRLVDETCDALKAISLLDVTQAPCWIINIPAEVEADEIVACCNGLLHIGSRRLIPHTPEFFNLNSLKLSFENTQREPMSWLSFLESIWPNDAESILSLQEWFGLLLTRNTSFQKALIIIGPKRSGKGTIGRILKELIGIDNSCSPTFSSLGQQFGIASLVNKQLALISDARLSGRADLIAVSENILRITGEDSLSVPRKFLPDWEGFITARFVIFTNEIPAMNDSSGALTSRFIVLRLKKSFLGEEDRGLTEKLLAELPLILNWALKGLDRLYANGRLTQPKSADSILEQMESISSPVKEFVADNCIFDPSSKIECSHLYAGWKKWCEEQNHNPGSIQMFGRNLTAAFPSLEVKQLRISNIQRRFYMGIRQSGFEDFHPTDPVTQCHAAPSNTHKENND